METNNPLPQSAYNPTCPLTVEENNVLLNNTESSISKHEFVIIMDEMINTLRDEKRTSNAYDRLASKIIDSLLWKLFKIFTLLVLIASVIVSAYGAYYYFIREDVDNVYTRFVGYLNHFVELITKLVELIEKLYTLLVGFGEGAEKVVHEMKTQVLSSDDAMDAIFLAIN